MTIIRSSATTRSTTDVDLVIVQQAARAISLRIGLGETSMLDSAPRAARIALVDGLVSHSCPALEGVALEVADASDGIDVDAHAGEHATMMASVIAGSGDGLLGLCPEATVISIPAVTTSLLRTDDARVVATGLEQAIDRALALRADVIVLGIELVGESFSLAARISRAIDAATEQGVSVIVPAGNTGQLGTPIGVRGAVPAVPAGHNGRPLRQATLSFDIAARGFLVPGIAVPAMTPNGALTLQAGSSFAAAVLVGSFGRLFGRTPHVSTTMIWSALGSGRGARCHSLVPPSLDVAHAFHVLLSAY